MQMARRKFNQEHEDDSQRQENEGGSQRPGHEGDNQRQESEGGSQRQENEGGSQWPVYEDEDQSQVNEDDTFSKTIKRVIWGFVILCVLGFFGYIAIVNYNHPINKVKRQVKQWEAFKTKQGLPSWNEDQNPSETNPEPDTDGNFKTNNCMFDDEGNLFVAGEDGYEPYIYDAFPNIPANLHQIVQALDDGENYLKLDYHDQKLSLYYALGDSKSRIVGGNVDIFNFSIDREKDIIAFSVECLTFYEYLEDDYRPHLQKTFHLVFGEESGQKIFDYLMTFYGQSLEVETQDETLIDGMRVTYRLTPKHRLTVYLR